jgi:hypothetical protein
MKSNFENRLSMYEAVLTHLDDNNSIWAADTAFNIRNRFQFQIKPITGIARDKKTARALLAEQCILVSGIIYGYATAINNNELAQVVNIPQSVMVRLRDTELVETADNIKEAADAHLPSMTGYSLTQPMIDDLQDYRDTFHTILARPRNAISSKKTSTADIRLLFAQSDTILKGRLDKLIIAYRTPQHIFYADYFNNRIVIDARGGNSGSPGNGGSGSGQLTYSGTVTDNVTGALIEGAVLTFGPHTTQSNAQGEFTISFTITQVTSYTLTVTRDGYANYTSPIQFSPGVNQQQEINMARTVLNTYQETVGMNTTISLGSVVPAATGIRITLISGSEITIGLSANGTVISGNTETINTPNQPVDRTITEMGGHQPYVMAQNNQTSPVNVKVEILG